MGTCSGTGDWFLGKEGENCDAVCASTGNICDIFLMFEHNVDVDTSDKAKALFAKHGRTCRTAVDANGRDLPFITSGGICLYTAQRDESWMSTCTANSGKANLCFCCTPAAPKAPDDCAACDGCLWRGQCRDRTHGGYELQEASRDSSRDERRSPVWLRPAGAPFRLSSRHERHPG